MENSLCESVIYTVFGFWDMTFNINFLGDSCFA